MNIDWNWFFSSFSQSAAALLGIIGAFIISRLIGIDEKCKNLESEFDLLVLNYKRIKETLSVRRFKWINRILLKHDDDLIKQIKKREYENLTNDQILEKLYKQDHRLYKSDEVVLNTFQEIYNENKPEKEPDFQPGEIRIVRPEITLPKIAPKGTWDKVSAEKDLINKYIIDAAESIRKFELNLNNIGNFESSLKTIRLIVWTLILAFPILVIYPLHFLPLKIGNSPEITFNLFYIVENIATLENILLLIFMVTVSSIFTYFLFLIRHIKTTLKKIEESNLEEYRKIESYCPYYRE
ncbi:hypothetical protein [Gramella sp. KN1008]|uniref:hypothetical protein n=1 Tax=Gramella sp. KN1008 TaxID=2529298 RepID=UPI00103AF907|nr:hypothetical protein [Gramella sp. KN1008]TBW25546.1 hypothetical protein EZJ28_15935 [Gramella sp. KN1008]